MQLPIVAPAPIVRQHAEAFKDLFENQKQYRHFQNYLTGLIVLPNKSMANISRCTLDSADKTNLSRFMSESPWFQEQVNHRRLSYMNKETKLVRTSKSESALAIDDSLCEHVGSLFEYVDRHYDHADDSYPIAHNPVTSHYVSGAVRFPVDLRLYRRYEEITQWEKFVLKHFPGTTIPKKKKERQKLHKQVDDTLLQDPEFLELHQQFRTKIDLAIDLVRSAIRHRLRFNILLFDGWYLSEALVAEAERRHKKWISILKKNRNLETNSFQLKDANGQPIKFEGEHVSVEEFAKQIPANAFKMVVVNEKIYWTFSLTVRIPSLGKVRLVISYENGKLTDTYVVLVTNALDWEAKRIIATYLLRWPIETFYQDGKELLGLDEYLMRDAKAIGKHWCLVFVAYSLLHLDCLPSPLAKEQLPTKSIGETCRQQARALIELLVIQAHKMLQDGESAKSVFDSLFAKQLTYATA
ncbi:MAG TPA: transposase [Anaerolineales bacterium]|jgi:SRSO17 transposase|nr:transposase [Anaerolineales bacterium]